MAGARYLALAVIALVSGFAGAALFAWSGLDVRLGANSGGDDVRDYLLARPEVLREASEELQRRDLARLIEPLRGEIETPFPGAVLGNPQGSITLVEFSDYACGFCRSSLADVDRLIAANPDLKVVVREYPVLSPQSLEAARMALAAAEQGRFAQFHRAMFAAGALTPEAIETAALRAGVDLDQARGAIALGRYDGQLESNVMLAERLGLTGTPSWIVGDQALTGAVGAERIADAIENARAS